MAKMQSRWRAFKVEDGVAKLKMKYKTPEDYTAFNGIELYRGKVVASLAAGYVYDGEFARVEEGKVVELPQNRIFTLRMI